MNEEPLAASVLFVQSGALLVSQNGFINFFAIVQCQANPSLHCTSGVWRRHKGIYNLNSGFENADRLIEQKCTGSQFHYIAPLAL